MLVIHWRSVGQSREKIESLDLNIAPEVKYSNETKISIKCNDSILIQQTTKAYFDL